MVSVLVLYFTHLSLIPAEVYSFCINCLKRQKSLGLHIKKYEQISTIRQISTAANCNSAANCNKNSQYSTSSNALFIFYLFIRISRLIGQKQMETFGPDQLVETLFGADKF